MKRLSLMGRGILIMAFALTSTLLAQEPKPIQLPKPQMEGGKPLMQVLKERQTTRTFAADSLPLQVLSNLLWAGFGINRPETDGRTAPSAMNWQEIDIYVATAEGLYLYDAKTVSLKPILSEDIRAKTGGQPFVGKAPVNLIFVADNAKAKKTSVEDQNFYSAADCGFIAQNVYLFCASEGLGTVVRGSVDRENLAKLMKLRPNQRIILAQTVGYPEK